MPFFMIGTQRSGSNLLRLMIDQLDDITAPHPPHILERMMPLIKYYNNLEEAWQFGELIDQVCLLVEKNPVPWDSIKLDRAEVAKRCHTRSLMAVYGTVHDMLAEAKDCRTWCCKSLANVHFLAEIEDYFSNEARYIYLYRDGRDVGLSFRKAIVGEKTWYHIAKQWHEEQQKAIQFRQLIPATRFFSIDYESLTREPAPILQRLCKFMDVDYHPNMLDFYKSEEAQRTAIAGAMWANVKQPIQTNNSGKFLHEASKEEICIFESVAGASLDALGYQRAYVQPGKEMKFNSIQVAHFDADNEKLKFEAKQRTPPEDLKLRKPQTDLLNELKRHLTACSSTVLALNETSQAW